MFWKVITFAFVFLACFCSSAGANVGLPFIAEFAGFSLRSVMDSTGLALLLIISIEALVLVRCLRLTLLKALSASAAVNVFSTILGIGAIFFSVGLTLPLLIFSFLFGLIIYSSMLFSVFKTEDFVDKHKGEAFVISQITVMSLFVLQFFLASKFPSFMRMLTSRTYHYEWSNTVTIAMSTAVLIVTGYLFSIISEGFLLQKMFKLKKALKAVNIF